MPTQKEADGYYQDEGRCLYAITEELRRLAWQHALKRPKMTTLIEEFAESVLSARGKHEHPLRLELTQIASICMNMIVQIDNGEDVANLRTK